MSELQTSKVRWHGSLQQKDTYHSRQVGKKKHEYHVLFSIPALTICLIHRQTNILRIDIDIQFFSYIVLFDSNCKEKELYCWSTVYTKTTERASLSI